MSKARTLLSCAGCGQQLARWAGRCPGCGAWGTIEERGPDGTAAAPVPLRTLDAAARPEERRAATGLRSVDRVLGGGLVPGSVTLLAGEPGIGKSTLLLQLAAGLSTAGLPCLIASGEESRAQVASRAARLGVRADDISFVAGRELAGVIDAARATHPFLLAVDSVQTLRDGHFASAPGGPAQVRACVDALIGMAKESGVAVLLTGHVTKDGDVAGPRTLEHAVDVVLAFDGDPASGARVLAASKNRFGSEGEVAWFDMTADGLRESDPTAALRSGAGEPGSATALPLAGRRALAVEVQALVVPGDGPRRRHTTGLDARRFALVAAVLDRVAGTPLGGCEVFGASAGGVSVSDPSCDLAVAAALASAVTGLPPPSATAFVGEIGLTGLLRAAPGLDRRIGAARAAGCSTVYAPEDAPAPDGVRLVPVRHLRDALGWIPNPASAGRPRPHALSPA